MAVSFVSFTPTTWNDTTTPKSTAGTIAWSSGNVIVVVAGNEDAGTVINAPTNANLTFTLRTSITTGGGAQSAAYLWTAQAGSAQSSQAIQISRGNPGVQYGAAGWVLAGASGSFANASANQTESGFTFTPSAGSGVCYFFADFAAAATNQTLATGTGTGNERADSNSANWGWYAGEWVNVTASSTTFGVTSYAGMTIAHVVIEILASASAATSLAPYRSRYPRILVG